MPTTTFVDVKMTQKVENYRHEKQEYTFSEGDVVSLPYHTGSRFVNQWGYAVYEKGQYEVDNEDYESVLCRVREEGEAQEEKLKDIPEEENGNCKAEKSDGEICYREKPCPYHDDE